MVLLPAARDPQVTEVIGVLQALSENTDMPGEVAIDPDEGTLVLTVIAAKVEAVSAKAATVRMITMVFDVLIIATVISPLNVNSCIKT